MLMTRNKHDVWGLKKHILCSIDMNKSYAQELSFVMKYLDSISNAYLAF